MNNDNIIYIANIPKDFILKEEHKKIIYDLIIDRMTYGTCMYFIKDGDIKRIPPSKWYKNAT